MFALSQVLRQVAEAKKGVACLALLVTCHVSQVRVSHLFPMQ